MGFKPELKITACFQCNYIKTGMFVNDIKFFILFMNMNNEEYIYNNIQNCKIVVKCFF